MASVVLGGALKERGMVSFAPVVDAEAEAEAMRAYVIDALERSPTRRCKKRRARSQRDLRHDDRHLVIRADRPYTTLALLGATGFDVGGETPGACRVVSNS